MGYYQEPNGVFLLVILASLWFNIGFMASLWFINYKNNPHITTVYGKYMVPILANL